MTELSGSGSRVFWILGRRFLRHNLFEVAESLPESKRKSALSLLVRKWSPFVSTQFSAQWVGHRASVYAWDADQVNAAIRESGNDPATCTVWPETFFRPPGHDAVRLAVMTDGLEGQVWKGELLVATRWWPAMPSPREWLMFLRSASVDLSQVAATPPAPVQNEFQPLPWTTQTSMTSFSDVWGLVQNNRAAAIAATVLVAPFLYYGTEAAVLWVATMRAEGQIAGMSAANQSVRADRTAALGNLDVIESYLSLEKTPPQFELFSAAAKLLSDQKVLINEWIFDGNNLDLTIQSDHALDAGFFIERFERDDHFSNVTGNLANQERELHLKMQVDPKVWPTA